eukprot:GEMP01032236.1.p1 GENE.GEMP01032236.1~~GEMP01032236.1.p1  ORF type:complete len:363 (+),score=53.23 GEMP01032236.1:28-1116(+)
MLQPSKGEAGESIVTVPLGKTLDSQPKAPSLVETLDKIRESDSKKYVTLPGITTHHILAAFNNMDLDKNGYIGAMELRCILNQLGHDSSDEIIDEMIRMVDSEGIGQCSVEDYWRLLHSAAFVSEMQALKPGVKESALELKMKGNAILQNNVKNFTQTLTTREAGQKLKNADKRGRGRVGAIMEKRQEDFAGLKPHQLQRIYNQFKKIDRDQKGFIDYREFCLVLEQPDSVVMKRLFEMFDLDKSGTLELREFIVGLSNCTSSSREERVRFAFMMFDEDCSGFIERLELCKILKANFISQRANDAEINKRVDKILEIAGVGPQGKLDFTQFLHVSNTMPGIMFPTYALLAKIDEALPYMKLF